jgi:hypothetical protein
MALRMEDMVDVCKKFVISASFDRDGGRHWLGDEIGERGQGSIGCISPYGKDLS